jgi:DNA-binding response OmpR family regulator
MKILIIEDDVEVLDFLKNSLINIAHTVDTSTNGADGSYLARTNSYDMIIIDYSLPEKNGFTVCTEIRSSGSNSPIIFLSMNHSVQHKISCLEAGADDYMTKPFSFEELNARIKALQRRPEKIESFILYSKDLILDTKKKIASRGGEFIYLTRIEYDLLEYLLRNKGMVLSRGVIMEHVWNAESDPFSNTVESHIVNLRKKINLKNNEEMIRNMPGRGYIIDQ